MGCLIAFRLCRSRVLALAVALLALFVSQGWASCVDLYANCSGGGVTRCEDLPCYGNPSYARACPSDFPYSAGEVNGTCDFLQWNYYHRCCNNKIEADSVNCVSKGDKWNSLTGKCEKDCKTRACCDSVAQHSPVETDTTWEGCVSDGYDDRCIVYNTGVTPGDTTISATCNGKSRYRICTKQWMWSESAKQCAQLESYNCVNYDTQDSNCTNIRCYATQQHALSSLDYDNATKCYTGTETVQWMMLCENGNTEAGTSYTRPFKVCDSYLDSLGTDISQYISGATGYSGTGIGTGGGVNAGAPSDNGMASGYNGGTSTDAQGNEVENSASPGIGGQWTPTPQIVTQYDSTTGQTTIVKNSSGGDSIQVQNVFSNIRCLGVSNGVATLTNGLNTWSCEAMSCSQATLSASINQGQCSPMANGVTRSETNPSMPAINGDGSTNIDWNSNEYEMLEQGLAMVTATLNAINADQKKHNDSLAYARNGYWKAVFGNDLSNVDSIRVRLGDVNTSVQGVETAVAGLGDAVSQNASTVSTAVGNASTNVSNAVSNAASSISGSVSAGATKVTNAVNNASSDVSTAVGNAASSVTGSVDNMKSTLRDTLHNGNVISERIETAVADTGRNIPTVLKSIEGEFGNLPSKLDSVFTVDMESWSNDKLKIMMDSNTVKVVDALDNLNVDVQLDSIRVQVPHDTILDSIRSDLKARGDFSLQQKPDTIDFGKIFQQGFDTVKGDTSFAVDSSLSRLINSAFYVEGSDFSDDTNVDSITSEINRKLDSSNVAHNARSDSLTGAYVDTMMKYSGLSTGAPAVQQFFAQGGNDACPRNCLDLSLTNPFVSGAEPTRIQFSTYLCDLKIFANYSVLDFIKLILRLMTSLLCLMFIWSSVGKRGDSK